MLVGWLVCLSEHVTERNIHPNGKFGSQGHKWQVSSVVHKPASLQQTFTKQNPDKAMLLLLTMMIATRTKTTLVPVSRDLLNRFRELM